MAENGQAARTLRIATARIDHVAAQGEKALNITVKSATGVGKLMAPKWDMVRDFKKGRIDWAAYTAQYHKLLQGRYAANKPAFHQLIDETAASGKCLVLVCYCNVGHDCDECHRFLMADYLEKIARKAGYEVQKLDDLSRQRAAQRSVEQASLPLEF